MEIQTYSNGFKRSLIKGLEANDRQLVSASLSEFKTELGSLNYGAILSIPRQERLPEMAKTDLKRLSAVISVSLTKCFMSMNLSRPMNEEQIFDLTDAIIDSSKEDYLSLEDLLLFLQGLVRGKYGPLYESMDIPKFMEKFEVYREERHRAYENIKYEAHSNHKAMGDSNRTTAQDQLQTALDKFSGSIGALKKAI